MAATTENKPLYAIAGAADAAVGLLRGLPNRVAEATSDPSLRDQVRAKINELPEDAKQWRTDAGEFVENLPTRAHEFPGRVSEFFANVSHDAGETYQEMASRGEGVVAKLRNDYGPKVDEVVGTVRTRVSKASDDVEDAVTMLRSKSSDVVDDLTGAAGEDAPTADRADTGAAPTVTTTKPAAREVPTKKAATKKAATKKAATKAPTQKTATQKTATQKAATKKASAPKATPAKKTTTKAPAKKSSAITEADDA